jgi:hypothetical protein
VPAGIIFAFRIEMVRWPVNREMKMEENSEWTW